MTRRRRKTAPTADDATALAAIVDHTIRCFDPDCRKCAEWEELLEADGAHGLAQAIRTADIAAEGLAVLCLAMDLLEAVRRARTVRSHRLAGSEVEDALQRLAQRLGFPMPPPPRRKAKRRPRVD